LFLVKELFNIKIYSDIESRKLIPQKELDKDKKLEKNKLSLIKKIHK
jgi:hypothetical protein